MKKILSIFITTLLIFNTATISFASEINTSKSGISKDDFNLIFSVINNNTWTENGQSMYIDDFCITYNNYTSDINTRSVYQDTKTNTETFTASKDNSVYITLSQTVKYYINDYTNSVEILFYSATIEDLPSGYSYYIYKDPYIINSGVYSYAYASKTFNVSNPSTYTFLVDCNVKVAKTGKCSFSYNFI